jgi:hypothetical protein
MGIAYATTLGPYLVPAYRLASGIIDNSSANISYER